MLSETSIKALKPTSKHQMLADRDGLYLRVHPSGKKQFLVRSRVGGKAKYTNIGDYPTMSLAAARKRVLEIAVESTTTTVDKLFEMFYKHVMVEYEKPEMVKTKYENNIKPYLGHMALTDVTRADVSKVLQKIVDRGSRTMATRLSDLGVAPHIIEKMLNHKMSGVMDVYNRAEYLPERKAAWRLWGSHLAAVRRRVIQNTPRSALASRVCPQSSDTSEG